jgi:hypothetical protein
MPPPLVPRAMRGVRSVLVVAFLVAVTPVGGTILPGLSGPDLEADGLMERLPVPDAVCAAQPLPGCPAWHALRNGPGHLGVVALPGDQGVVVGRWIPGQRHEHIGLMRLDGAGVPAWEVLVRPHPSTLQDFAVAGDAVVAAGSVATRGPDGPPSTWPLVVGLAAADGAERWAILLPWTGARWGQALDVAVAEDGLVAVTGTYAMAGTATSAFTALVDPAAGAMRWLAIRDHPSETVGRIVAIDGEVVLTSVEAWPGGAGRDAIVEARSARDGGLRWEASYASPGLDRAAALALAPRQGIALLAGTSESTFATPTHGFVAAFRLADGAPAWFHRDAPPDPTSWTAIAVRPQQELVVVAGSRGGAAPACVVRAFLPGGVALWDRSLDGEGGGRCSTAHFHPDGQRLLVGATLHRHGSPQAALVNLDPATGWTTWAGYDARPLAQDAVHGMVLVGGGARAVTSGTSSEGWVVHAFHVEPALPGASAG